MSIASIRGRMAVIGITQERLARHLGMAPAVLSRVFSGLREPPLDFEQRATEALDVLERAKAAGRDAEQRVLAKAASQNRA